MKNLYFIGNAHLDPVWMWRWQEGSTEAKATVRSALDRMKEYPDFKFVCAGASVYMWIEEFAPEMLDEIRERVKEGRWILVGGQFVQPDCNLPSGEAFARHSLYSQRYFYDKFGKTARTGYNVDSFGHNLMIPQILKKSGMDQYVFMRPGEHEKSMSENLFRWRSPDGSEVLAYRIPEPYCFNATSIEKLEEQIKKVASWVGEDESAMLFYGVGNHGGGPTKLNIELIKQSAAAHPECRYTFSDPDEYFKEQRARIDQLTVHTDDLQHHASGCYSAVSEVKSLIRKGENALLHAERANMMAAHLCGKPYITEELAHAWRNVMFAHFHDIAGGCSIESAYDDTRYMIGESISVSERAINNAYQTISWAIDTQNAEKGYPIVIFNSLPFDVHTCVEINRQAAEIYAPDGNKIPLQHVYSESHATYGKCNTVFMADLPALGYATYYLKGNEEPFYHYMQSEIKDKFDTSLSVGEDHIENGRLRVSFDVESGYICSIYDKDEQKELLSGFGAVPVVIDEQGHDTWSHAKNFFTDRIGKFANAKIKILEDGPVRAMIEVRSQYNRSEIIQRFSLTEDSRSLDVSVELDWHEEHKMLKIAYDVAVDAPRAYYEIPFGIIERPADGEEEPGYRWFALGDGKNAYAILNSEKYSFSAEGKTMYLTAARSPLYADHGMPPSDRSRFTDQGMQRFSYIFTEIGDNGFSSVIKTARLLNTAPVAVLENNHKGYLRDAFRGVSSDANNVHISAVKRSEDGKGTVIRIYESEGRDTDVTICGELIEHHLKVRIGAYSMDTYYLADGESEWREVLTSEL